MICTHYRRCADAPMRRYRCIADIRHETDDRGRMRPWTVGTTPRTGRIMPRTAVLVSYATRGHGRLGVSSAEREAPPSLAGPSENHHPRACWHRPRYRPFKQAMLFPQSVSSAGQRACRKQFIDGLLMRPRS